MNSSFEINYITAMQQAKSRLSQCVKVVHLMQIATAIKFNETSQCLIDCNGGVESCEIPAFSSDNNHDPLETCDLPNVF